MPPTTARGILCNFFLRADFPAVCQRISLHSVQLPTYFSSRVIFEDGARLAQADAEACKKVEVGRGGKGGETDAAGDQGMAERCQRQGGWRG